MTTPSDSDYGSPFRIRRRGLMLVLSSPSGAGKTTISRTLLEREDNLAMSVSVTTRDKREEEVAGGDYHFIDKSEFNLMVNRKELLEYAKVFDNYYGTPRAPVEEELAKGHDVLFDVDWQGAQQLEQNAGDDLVGIFILPPSTAELERRLHGRAQDSDEVVAVRMAQAADEMSHWDAYDYIIVNDDVEDSVTRVQAILQAERLRRKRQTGLAEFVKGLREGQ
ncbi:MAG: guanylate kinase [Rhodospirillaceae bacterium]|jgi:guanylate kinase|nr:guanylate kinase [Rhodospirillaceae bacterium]MDP6486299.1 guanylate kinase [Alphaproteobacteria bacterium]MDP6660110.1 guanylate kinase [Alphaproteobacteria bacterium]MDP6780538.1 guanylate kinase [Alphaproteobacteria bacterium]MDP7045387.1 guanylate kinase [Alphaproteobacteria bacterium]|tara:strand:- start:410 stop:1075 length:666 start_codon:yes stop_codon:yes gene_type:complete